MNMMGDESINPNSLGEQSPNAGCDEEPRLDGVRVGMVQWRQVTSHRHWVMRGSDMHWLGEIRPEALSGMPWAMARALKNRGAEIVPIEVGENAREHACLRILKRLSFVRRFKTSVLNGWDSINSSRLHHSMLADARGISNELSSGVARFRPDVVFGSCMSHAFSFVESDVPILYFSDATAALINKTYFNFAAKGNGYHRGTEEIETRALSRVDLAAFASDASLQSSWKDHGRSLDRSVLIPMGANVQCSPNETIELPASPPDRGDLRLLLVASCPKRKRLMASADLVLEMRRRGWNAVLEYIGPSHAACRQSHVSWSGKLQLSNPKDAVRHRSLLRESHFSLLLSEGEMFGISPIESASYGRPAMVTGTGGLPTVVQDGKTGRIVSNSGSIEEWADALEEIVNQPELYRSMSLACHQRYLTRLNWNAWGGDISRHLSALVHGREPGFRYLQTVA